MLIMVGILILYRCNTQKLLQQMLCFFWLYTFYSHAYHPIEYWTPRPCLEEMNATLEPVVRIYKPSGLSFIFEWAKDILQFIINININHPFNGSVPYLTGDISDFLTNIYRDSPLEYRNNRIKLRVGDKVYYWYVFIFKNFRDYVRENMSFVVRESENGDLYPEPFPSYHIVNSDLLPFDY